MDSQTTYYKMILENELAKRTERNSRYSLRSFAKSLKLVPSAVSEILTGKRLPSPKMAQKIVSSLQLSPEDSNRFIQSLALAHQQRSSMRPVSFQKKSLQPPKELSIEMFRVIAEWYHSAILELTFVEGFQSNYRWIASQLGLTQIEVKLAVSRLFKLGLLVNQDGTWIKSEAQVTTADKHMTNVGLQKMQKQCLEKAILSLQEDPIENRSMTTMTMAIDPERLTQAKEKIKKFNRELCAFLESGNQKKVYNLTIGLYPIQKRSK